MLLTLILFSIYNKYQLTIKILQIYKFFRFRKWDTCSACDQKGAVNSQIITDAHSMPQQKIQAAPKEQVNHEQKVMSQTIKANQKISKIGTVVSKLGESKGYNYKKLDNGGIVLNELPKFTTTITQQKRQQLGPFVYDKQEYQDPQAQKKSTILFQNRYAYEGQWKNNERSGRGIQIWKDGSIYQGYWKNNLANGYGRLIHTDGDVYIGQWKHDRANGMGKYISNYGAQYFGNWKDDKQQGHGQQKWKDGAFYKGEYHGGKKQGNGTFIWGDDSSYQGQFFQNNIHGKGKYVWKDGRVYEGQWNNNKMHGKGVFNWPDGRKYDGQYQNDKKHGFGIFTFKDGRVYEGQWQNGKQHGRGIYKKKKIAREGIWQHGLRIKWLDNKQNQQNQMEKSNIKQ